MLEDVKLSKIGPMSVIFLESPSLECALHVEVMSGMGRIEFSKNLIESSVMLIEELSVMKVLLRSSQGFNQIIIPLLFYQRGRLLLTKIVLSVLRMHGLSILSLMNFWVPSEIKT